MYFHIITVIINIIMMKEFIYIGLLLLLLEQFLECDLLGTSMHFKMFKEGGFPRKVK